MAYSPTTWTEGVTTLGPTNMNKIETELARLKTNADLDPAAAIAVSKFAVGSNGDRLATVSGAAAWKTPQASMATSASPTGTTSTTGVMMGIAGSITPSVTGKILIFVSGSVNNSVNGNGATYQAYYGTGTAPTNGAALTGTSVGIAPRVIITTANQPYPLSFVGLVTGLTLGTAYWIDLSLAAISGGTAALGQVDLVVFEI